MKNRIIFTTNLTLWSMGAGNGGPAFTKTVQKYIDEGWEVYLLSDEPSNAEYPELDSQHNIQIPQSVFSRYTNIRKIGVIFRYLEQLACYFSFNREIDKLLKQDSTCQPTLIYAYEWPRFFPARHSAKKYGLPLVTRFQGTYPAMLKGRWIDRIRMFPAFEATESPADLVIMTDDGTFGDEVLKKLGNPSPFIYLKNGLDLLEYDIPAMKGSFDRDGFRKTLGIAPNETMFLTVSRLTGWKKVDRAIRGFADGHKNMPSAKLVIAGDGDQKPDLMELADSLGVHDQVIFTGAVPHAQVHQYMMASDVFLSLYDDSNVGNPLLEAMTLGTCIITLDVGDTRSLIYDRENGILLTYETLSTLGSVMAELATDEKKRENLGAAAAQYAQANFHTWKERMDIEFQTVSTLLKPNA